MTKYTPEANIRAERVRSQLTQADMAKKIGISVTSFNVKECGKRQFTLPEFLKICEILNLKPDDLHY